MVLTRGQVLFEPHEPVSHVHFPAGAVLSLVIPTADGHIAEAATVGREGAIGAVANGTKRTAFSRGSCRSQGLRSGWSTSMTLPRYGGHLV